MFLKKTDPRPVVNEKLTLPAGLVVETSAGFFYIKNDVRIRIDEQVLATWRFVNVPLYAEASLAGYPIKGQLPFRDGTFLQRYTTGQKYYASAGRLKEVRNPQWLERLGINNNDIIVIKEVLFQSMTLGEPLD